MAGFCLGEARAALLTRDDNQQVLGVTALRIAPRALPVMLRAATDALERATRSCRDFFVACPGVAIGLADGSQ